MSATSGDGRRPGHPSFTLMLHATAAIGERGIALEWIAPVHARPNRTQPDRHDPNLRHALGRIAEREGRVLRVVYNGTVVPWRVVTVYFDRTPRHKP